MNGKRLLRISEVIAKTGRCRASIYRDIQNKTFPAHIKIGPRASAWLESEVDAWIELRVTESRSATQGG